MRALIALMVALLAAPVLAKPVVQPVEWGYRSTVFNGFVVYDDSSTKLRPGLLMVPNWMGVNDSAVEKAKTLAGTDYVVLVVDMYGRDIRPKNAAEASAAAKAVYADRPEMRARIVAAVAALQAAREMSPLDETRLGAVGYCFGGSTVLELARSGNELRRVGTKALAGVVSFHGGVTTTLPAKGGQIMTSILVLNGADDTSVPPADIATFEKEMDDARANDWKVVNFEGARHCFAEPDANSPPNCLYHEPSARKANALMREFFAKRFSKDLNVVPVGVPDH